MAADVKPFICIKQLKRRPMQTTAVFRKGNWKLTDKSSYKMKDSFRDRKIEGVGGGGKVERESRGWASVSIHAFHGIP